MIRATATRELSELVEKQILERVGRSQRDLHYIIKQFVMQKNLMPQIPIRRIRQLIKKSGLKGPEFREHADFFKVVLYNEPIDWMNTKK